MPPQSMRPSFVTPFKEFIVDPSAFEPQLNFFDSIPNDNVELLTLPEELLSSSNWYILSFCSCEEPQGVDGDPAFAPVEFLFPDLFFLLQTFPEFVEAIVSSDQG